MTETEKKVDSIISALCDKHMRIINLQQKQIDIMNQVEAQLSKALDEAHNKIEELEMKVGFASDGVVVRINHGIGEMHISAKGSLAMKQLAQTIKDFIETKGVTDAITILEKYCPRF